MNKLSLTAVALVLAAAIPAGAATISLGYTGTSGSPIGGPLPTAAAARTSFLGSITGNTFVEDFQDASWTNNAAVTSHAMSFAGPSGSLAGTYNLAANSGTTVATGIPSANNWGSFGGLQQNATAAANKWLAVYSSVVTMTFAPGVDAIGFFLNDVADLKKTITVTFTSGQSTSIQLGSAVTNGALANQNLYFVGLSGAGSLSSVTISGASGSDGIGLDDVIVGKSSPLNAVAAVPLPSSALSGAALLAGVAVRRRIRRK